MKKVYIVISNYFDGCENYEGVDSVHETEESALTQQLILEEAVDKPYSLSYYIREFELQNIKL